MRLQLRTRLLVLTSVAIFVPPRDTRADEPKADARLDVYTDDLITVVSPSARVELSPVEHVDVDLRYAIDVLSGATTVLNADVDTGGENPDIISSATHFTERRHLVHASGKWTPEPTWSAGVGYTLSTEFDYDSHALTIDGSVEVLDRLATISATYGLGYDIVGKATDAHYAMPALKHSVDLSWLHILSPSTTLTILFGAQVNDCSSELGCQANPYRFVPLVSVDDMGAGAHVAVTVPERNPDLQIRTAGALRLSHDFGLGIAVHGGYRLYRDNWSVVGHTGDLEIAKSLADEAVLVRLDARGSVQSAANFYRDRYETDAQASTVPEHRTADRELSGLWSVQGGARLEWSIASLGLFDTFRLNARVARIHYEYPNFTELPTRDAWLVGGGANAEF